MDTPRVAYLGPAGSYTELALRKHLPQAESIACYSIAEVFRLVDSGEVTHGFVPIENLIEGPVTETLDLLFEYKNRVYIEQSVVAEICHALGVLPTETSEQSSSCVRRIYSREQALRQCSKYLRTHYPQAELLPTASTGSAAALVQDKSLNDAAVIAAASTLEQYGFEVLDKDIADIRGNKTRFAALRAGNIGQFLEHKKPAALPENAVSDTSAGYVTSIVVDPGRDRQGLLLEILQVVSLEHSVNLLSIHSRPDTKGGFVFHLDLEGHFGEERIRTCVKALYDYCQHSTGETAEIIVCGSYPKTRFSSLPFHTIGIVGGEGKMGQWFSEFFRQTGLRVLVSDLNSGLSLKELCQESDVIILSVPMSAAAVAAREVCNLLDNNQLIVENCSIKSCVLPTLLDSAKAKVEILGIHTMFGQSTESIRGENVIVTKTSRSGEKAQAFEDLLYKHGAKITYASIEEHDRAGAFLQALTHLTLLGLTEVLRENFDSVESIQPFSTPNSRAMLQTAERILKQSESLIYDMQTLNVEYPELRKQLSSSLSELIRLLEEGNEKEFLERVRKAKSYLLEE